MLSLGAPVLRTLIILFLAELHAGASVAPYLRKFSNLPIREILVIT